MNSATLEMFDAVRAVLNGRSMPDDQRRDLAMRISETATAYRKRVDRAVRYARLGLRLEAASEAEAEPALFELAQHLDTESLHNWRALCARHQWPVPEAPDPAAIAEIEEAISQLRPQRRLLARMRLLVLSDAGPWERLELLRELISRDPDNPAWQNDMEALEPVAAAWLAENCERAVRQNQLDTAGQMLSNLEGETWQTMSMEKPIAALREHYDRAVVADCHRRGPEIVEAVEAEWAAEHTQGVAEQMNNWRALEARSVEHGGAMPNSLCTRIEAAEAWLIGRQTDVEARKEHAVRADALAALLSRGAPLGDLRRALAACDATVEGCPQDLRRQTLDEIGRLESRQQARRTMFGAAAILVVGAVVAGVWYGIVRSSHTTRIETLAAAIHSAVNTQDLDLAAQHLAEADKDFALAGDPAIVEARRVYMKARSERAGGDRDFDALMAAAGDPDSAEATPSKVEEAGRLARTEAQQKAVSEWTRLHKRAADARAAERTQEWLKELRALAQQVAGGSNDPDDAARVAALSDAETRIDAVARAAAGNPAVMAEAERARTLVGAQRASMQGVRAGRTRALAMRALASASLDPQALRLAMERFMTDNPGTPEADSLRAAIDASPLWQSLADWNGVVRGRNLAGAATMTQAQRDDLMAALRAYVTANQGSPTSAAAIAYSSYLVPADGWRMWLQDKLQNLPAFNYYTIEMKDGTRYYTLQDPLRLAMQTDANGKPYRIASVLTTGGADPQTAFQRIEDASVKSQGPSPQRTLAEALRPMAEANEEDPQLANGVQGAFTVLAKLRDAESVDGAFAAQVARNMLESLSPELPAPVQAQVQAAARAIAREKPDAVDWIGGTGGARDKSRALRMLVRDQLKVDQWRKAYADAVTAAAAPLLKAYQPAGMMFADAAGTGREIVAPDAQPFRAGAELLALRAGVGKEASVMVVVGNAGDKGAVTVTPAAASFPVGTMVFVRGGSQ